MINKESGMKDVVKKTVEAYKNADRYQRANIVYSMAGPRNITNRQMFLEELLGEKIPKAKCGIHRIEAELDKIVN
jgi:hypothetical protein